MTAITRPAPMVRPPLEFDRYRLAAFPIVVRRRREQLGMTRSAVAGLTGLTPEDVIDIETGTDVPTLDVVFALADVLGTDAAELLHETRAVAEDLVVDKWIARRDRARAIALATSSFAVEQADAPTPDSPASYTSSRPAGASGRRPVRRGQGRVPARDHRAERTAIAAMLRGARPSPCR